MKYTRFAYAFLLVGSLLAMTACGTAHGSGGTETTAFETTDVGSKGPEVEMFAFDRVSFEGECHTTEHLEEYLTLHLDDLLMDMSEHGITVDAYTEIRAIPIHIINLLTGSVGLHSHFLPVLERGELVNAVSVNLSNEMMSVSAAVSWPWMSKVNRVLTENPQETYLLTGCLIDGGNYICLISSQNEIVYIARPVNSIDLPFEDGVDYYGKLYDERLVISYARIYGM